MSALGVFEEQESITPGLVFSGKGHVGQREVSASEQAHEHVVSSLWKSRNTSLYEALCLGESHRNPLAVGSGHFQEDALPPAPSANTAVRSTNSAEGSRMGEVTGLLYSESPQKTPRRRWAQVS